MTRILVVDNYDSFVYNLVQYLAQLGAEVEVRRNDAVKPDELPSLNVDGVLISPGPGTPEQAGVSMLMDSACAELRLPVFGVCLGHQAIGAVYGGVVERAPELLHGKTSEVMHAGAGVLAGLPSSVTGCSVIGSSGVGTPSIGVASPSSATSWMRCAARHSRQRCDRFSARSWAWLVGGRGLRRSDR